MELLRAKIRQFRSIKDLTVPFAEADCLILLGINETGKSNILRALSLLSRTEKASPDDLRQVRHDEAEVEHADVVFVFRPSNDDIKAMENALLERTRGLGADLRLQESGDTLDIGAFARRYGNEMPYTVDVLRNRRTLQYWGYKSRLVLEEGWLVPTENCPASHHVNIPGVGNVQLRSLPILPIAARGADMPDEFFRPATAKDVEAIFWNVILSTADARLPECITWSFSQDSVLPPSTPLDPFIANPASVPVLKNMFELAEIDDIAGSFRAARQRANGVRALLSRVGKRVSTELQQLWTDKNVSIVLTENGPSLDSAIQDEHGVFDFQRRSDGFRRFASFMLMVSARARAGRLRDAILLYDEPDASLHPAAARQLRRELLRLSERCKVVYSTHSIFMVDPENVTRHLLVRRTNEETHVTRAKPGNVKDEEVLYQAIGHTIFAELSDHNLVLEGYKDRRLLDIALTAPASEPHAQALDAVGRCHMQGVKNVVPVTSMLDLVGRTYLIVTDGDAPALERRKEYSGPGRWVTYPELVADKDVVTAEDFIRTEKVLEALTAIAPSIPEVLAGMPVSLEPTLPMIRQLENALGTRQLSKERRRAVMEAVKDAIFSDLSPGDLRPNSTLLVAQLANEVRRPPSTP